MPQPRFNPGERTPVPIWQEAGWVLEPVWTQRLEEKSFHLCWESNLDHPVVQSVVRHYTDWATPAQLNLISTIKWYAGRLLIYYLQSSDQSVHHCFSLLFSARPSYCPVCHHSLTALLSYCEAVGPLGHVFCLAVHSEMADGQCEHVMGKRVYWITSWPQGSVLRIRVKKMLFLSKEEQSSTAILKVINV
jgi:hypothetical protein